MNQEKIDSRIKIGYILAFISGLLTLVMSVLGFCLQSVKADFLSYFADPSILFDIILIFALAYGIYKRSRICAISMFLYFLMSKIILMIEFGRPSGIVVSIIFLYFFFQAIIGTFDHHKLLRQQGIPPKYNWWIIIPASIVGLIVLLLICFGLLYKSGLIDYSEELSRIAQIYLDGDTEVALDQMDEYLNKHPDNDLAWTIKGNILTDIGMNADAMEAYEKAVSINKNNYQALTAMGILYGDNEQYDQQLECYQKALTIKPDYAQAYSSIAIVELKKHNDQKALELAIKAYNYDKEDAVIAANLAIIYHYNNMEKERDRFTQIASELGYDDIESLYSIYEGEIDVRDE
jgi:tetratricopeptide (TPR) repeat protein